MTLSPKSVAPAAIYCHALWRTGSTSLFNAFRSDSRFMCFYEPLHEGLRTLSPKKASHFDPEDVQRMGHNGLTRPYFQEYGDLVAHRRGVPNFPAHLSYGEFFDVSETGRTALKSYFRVLSDLAASAGRTPVFCLNRSWGRMATFRDIAPDAIHVFSLRNPHATWASLQKRRSYFFAKLLLISSKSDPLLMQREFPEFSNLSLYEKMRTNRTFKRKVREIPDERIAPLFWQAYKAALLNGILYADYILDLGHSDPTQDDRIALGQDLSVLRDSSFEDSLSLRLRALARVQQPDTSGLKTLDWPTSELAQRPTQLTGICSDGLREAACRAAPKLSRPNREILAGLISPNGKVAHVPQECFERTHHP